MTSFDYDGLAKSIQPDLKEFGQRAYLRKPGAASGTAYDPTVGAPVNWPIIVIESNKQIRNREGTLVEGAGLSIKVSTEGLTFVTPTKGDTIMMGPTPYVEEMTEYKILEVRAKQPGGVVVLYDIDLER